MATVLPKREFAATDAKREKVPLLVGLMGPSGGGKTFTALRLATGIQSVCGGDIYFIDTESRRGLHYADKFKFKHVPFEAPFGSLDYLFMLQEAVRRGAGVVIVDSMSHEHEGPGGMIDLQDQILNKMAGDNYGKRQAMQMLAWAEPKAKRRALINGILQLNCNFIFCFRAKNSSKPTKNPDTGKNEVVAQGFMPIAGDEFVFEQTLNALLLPGAGGVPTWHSDAVGERTMIKLPEQFAGLRQRNAPLDEKVGERLAKWAMGTPEPVQTGKQTTERRFEPADTQANDEFAEGPADQQRGEQHNATSTDEQTATSLIAQIADEKTSDALDSLMARTREQVDALPDDLQETVRSAYYARFEKLSK
jgi:ABC-type oligopeptide transport system ATPase subunit